MSILAPKANLARGACD